MVDQIAHDSVDALRLVEETARRQVGPMGPGRQFAAVLGPEDRTAIVCAPGSGFGSQVGPDRESRPGGADGPHEAASAVDVRLLSAVKAVAAGVRAVAWVWVDAGGAGVEIRAEDRSGRARRTWTSDVATNAWSREDTVGVLWTGPLP